MSENTTRDPLSDPEEKVDPAVLRAENASLQDRMLRALADAENTRRRAERNVEDARQYAIVGFARELLAVMDNLQRAVAAASQESDKSTLLEGVQATQRLLSDVFDRFGVKRIDALGVHFDPGLHEAVMEVQDDSYLPGSVGQVMEEGYTIHDRLLRPARVAVAKSATHKPPPHPEGYSRSASDGNRRTGPGRDGSGR
jgi:molecular chaperone GrpE